MIKEIRVHRVFRALLVLMVHREHKVFRDHKVHRELKATQVIQDHRDQLVHQEQVQQLLFQ